MEAPEDRAEDQGDPADRAEDQEDPDDPGPADNNNWRKQND